MNSTIAVGIVGETFQSHDEGATWCSAKREIPWRTYPRCYPDVSLPRISKDVGEFIDMVNVSDRGYGVAVGHRDGTPTRSSVWTTTNGGNTWESLAWDSIALSKPLSKAVWPPEKFDSAVVSAEARIFLAWTDPWILDGADSHLLTIHAGTASKYQRIESMCIRLSTTPGTCVRAFSFGHFWETTPLMDAWERFPFTISWKSLESCFDTQLGLLRCPQFVTENDGFALVVQRHLRQSRPPVTGLARTQDGGHHWEVISEWVGPIMGDMNERHVTELKILRHPERVKSAT